MMRDFIAIRTTTFDRPKKNTTNTKKGEHTMKEQTAETLEANAQAIIARADNENISGVSAYRLSIVGMYSFLENCVTDSEEWDRDVMEILGAADSKHDVGVIEIYQQVSDIIEEAEIEATKMLSEAETEAATMQGDNLLSCAREAARMMVHCDPHHTGPRSGYVFC